MSEETVLGIDIGTSATKTVLARADGSIIATDRRHHTVSYPHPGWAEHDADKTRWQDLLAVCTELAPHTERSLRGICVSGIGPCVVPCETLPPLRPAILYGIDARPPRIGVGLVPPTTDWSKTKRTVTPLRAHTSSINRSIPSTRGCTSTRPTSSTNSPRSQPTLTRIPTKGT